MGRFTPIKIEWNQYNGFIFEFFSIEYYKENMIDIASSLFGISFSKNFLYIELFFFNIKVFENYNK